MRKKIIIILIIVASLGLASFLMKNKLRKPSNILLLGGLDNRSGDLDIGQQVELINKGLIVKKKVDGFRYNDFEGMLNAINNSTQPMYVILFSAGTSKSKEIAIALNHKGFSLNNMFIVEPYANSINTSKSVIEAVKMGVPNKNVWVGTSKSTGMGVVNNTSSTPSCYPKHWCSLTELAKRIL